MKTYLFFVIAICTSMHIVAQVPVLDWAKSAGASYADVGHSLTVDGAGNSYVTGRFSGTVDFDPGTTIFNLTSAGVDDIFILKLDALGSFIWAKRIGGISYDYGSDIITDSSDGVLITGEFRDTVDFDPSAGTYNLISTGGQDIFILKLDSAGNFIWVKQMGGLLPDESFSIAEDAGGNIYTTGHFKDTADFDPGIGVYNLISKGAEDIFISKLDASGNFKWAKSIGGLNYDAATSVKPNEIGDIYVTGRFNGVVDFDPGIGVFNLGSTGTQMFVLKLDSSGTFKWAKMLEGSGLNSSACVENDPWGNIYLSGYFRDSVDFDPGISTSTFIADSWGDIFVLKLDSSGNFIWAKQMGGIYYDYGGKLKIDSSGNLYLTGSFTLTADFDPNAGIFNLTSAGADDIFVCKLDSSGNLMWALRMGGPNEDRPTAIALDLNGNIYTSGSFRDTADFDPGSGIYNLISHGYYDIFVHKMSQSPNSIQETNSSTSFNLFPNPSNGDFTILLDRQYDIVAVNIFNVAGKEIFNYNYHNTNTLNLTIEGAAGNYLYEVRNKNGVIKKGKIVKD